MPELHAPQVGGVGGERGGPLGRYEHLRAERHAQGDLPAVDGRRRRAETDVAPPRAQPRRLRRPGVHAVAHDVAVGALRPRQAVRRRDARRAQQRLEQEGHAGVGGRAAGRRRDDAGRRRRRQRPRLQSEALALGRRQGDLDADGAAVGAGQGAARVHFLRLAEHLGNVADREAELQAERGVQNEACENEACENEACRTRRAE